MRVKEESVSMPNVTCLGSSAANSAKTKLLYPRFNICKFTSSFILRSTRLPRCFSHFLLSHRVLTESIIMARVHSLVFQMPICLILPPPPQLLPDKGISRYLLFQERLHETESITMRDTLRTVHALSLMPHNLFPPPPNQML